MSKRLDLKSKVRVGMNAERSDVDDRLQNSGVVKIAQANVAHILDPDARPMTDGTPDDLPADHAEDQRIHVLSIDDCIPNPYNPRALSTARKVSTPLQQRFNRSSNFNRSFSRAYRNFPEKISSLTGSGASVP